MKEATLPELFDGESVTIADVVVRQKATKAPTPYTEGTLLDDMRAAARFVEGDPELKKVLKEASGLGTAATRDNILEGLKAVKYLVEDGKYLVPTQKGIAFFLWIERAMPELTDVATTARWEAELGVIAKKGNGAAFETRVAAMVERMVAILKVAPPLTGTNSSTTKESLPMTESAQRVSPPTSKMLDFATSIAKRLGTPVPPDVAQSFDACKKFLDDNKDTAMRPSDKQLNFATSIAEKKGLTVPPDALANGKLLSVWIDENK